MIGFLHQGSHSLCCFNNLYLFAPPSLCSSSRHIRTVRTANTRQCDNSRSRWSHHTIGIDFLSRPNPRTPSSSRPVPLQTVLSPGHQCNTSQATPLVHPTGRPDTNGHGSSERVVRVRALTPERRVPNQFSVSITNLQTPYYYMLYRVYSRVIVAAC